MINERIKIYDGMLFLLIPVLFSIGSINALIPIIIILILIIAAAGVNRGFSIFNIFGISTLAGINPGGKSSIAGKTAFSVILYTHTPFITPKTGVGAKVAARVKRLAKAATLAPKTYIASKAAAKGGWERNKDTGGRVTQSAGAAAPAGTATQSKPGFAVTQGRAGTSSTGTGSTHHLFPAAAAPAKPANTPKPPVVFKTSGAAYTPSMAGVRAAGRRTGSAAKATGRAARRAGSSALRKIKKLPGAAKKIATTSAAKDAALAVGAGAVGIALNSTRAVREGVTKAAKGAANAGDKFMSRPLDAPLIPAGVKKAAKKAGIATGRTIMSPGDAIRRGAKKLNSAVGKTTGRLEQNHPVLGAPARAVTKTAQEVQRVGRSDKFVRGVNIKQWREEFTKAGKKIVGGKISEFKPVLVIASPPLYVAKQVYNKVYKNNRDRYNAVSGNAPKHPMSEKAAKAAKEQKERFAEVHAYVDQKYQEAMSKNPNMTPKEQKALQNQIARELRQSGGKLHQVEGFAPPKATPTMIRSTIAGLDHALQATKAGARGETLEGTKTKGGEGVIRHPLRTAGGAIKGFSENAAKGAREIGTRKAMSPHVLAKKREELENERENLKTLETQAGATEKQTSQAAERSGAIRQQREKVRRLQREIEAGRKSRDSPSSISTLRIPFDMAIGGLASSKRMFLGKGNREETKKQKEVVKDAQDKLNVAKDETKAAKEETKRASSAAKQAHDELVAAETAHTNAPTQKTAGDIVDAKKKLADAILLVNAHSHDQNEALVRENAAKKHFRQELTNSTKIRYSEGVTAPFKSSVVERAVVEQKIRILRKTTNTSSLDKQLGGVEGTLSRENRKIEENHTKIADLATGAMHTRADYLVEHDKAQELRTNLTDAQDSLRTANLDHTRAFNDHQRSITDLNKAKDKGLTPDDIKGAEKRVKDAQTELTAKAKAAKDAQDHFNTTNANYKKQADKATGLGKEAVALEIEQTKKEAEVRSSEARMGLYHNLKTTIAGNKSLSDKSREELGKQHVTEGFLDGLPARDRVAAEKDFKGYVNNLESRKKQLEDAEKMATAAAVATQRGESNAQDLTRDAQIAAADAKVGALSDLPTETLRAKFEYGRAVAEQQRTRAVREEVAKNAKNPKEAEKFLANDDEDSDVKVAAIRGEAFSSSDAARENIGMLLTLEAGDDDAVKGAMHGVVKTHLNKGTFTKEYLETEAHKLNSSQADTQKILKMIKDL